MAVGGAAWLQASLGRQLRSVRHCAASATAERTTSAALRGQQLRLPETYVPPERDGEAGIYCSKSGFALQAVASNVGLRSWSTWYQAPWWLQQGDAMTLFAAFGRDSDAIEYDRHMVEALDGGILALDVVRTASGTAQALPPRDTAPFVLLVSGLGGGSQGGYVRNMATSLMRSGCAVAVLNMRGCAGSPLRTARGFSGCRGSTDDVRVAVRYAREVLLGGGSAAEQAPVLLLGWSLGGNIVANALAEQSYGAGKGHAGALTAVQAGAALAATHDMAKSSRLCEQRLASRVLYNGFVARSLVRQFLPYESLFRRGPVPRWADDEPVVELDVDMFLGASTIREIDEAMTRRVFGYDSVDEYYACASSCTRLDRVEVPLLLVSAADDPVSSEWVPIDAVRANPNLVLAYTAHGGHLGWQDDEDARRSKWVEQTVADFFDSTLRQW